MRKRSSFDEEIGVDVVKTGKVIYKANYAKMNSGNETLSNLDITVDER